MSEKPPGNVNEWSRKQLAREVIRLRAILHEHARRVGDDPRPASTEAPIIGGSPHGRGDSLVDARAAVLLESIDVVLLDTKRDDERVAMMMTLGGRINYADDRVTHAYLFGADGAAAIVSELILFAGRAAGADEHGRRFAAEFQALLDERMSEGR